MSEQTPPKSRNDTPLVETQWMTVEHVSGDSDCLRHTG